MKTIGSILAAAEPLSPAVQFAFSRVMASPFTSADYLAWLLTKNGSANGHSI